MSSDLITKFNHISPQKKKHEEKKQARNPITTFKKNGGYHR